jgi:integrase/recombinase XerD
MCLERVYEGAGIRRRLRTGPLGGLIDGFCDWLLERGGTRASVQKHVSGIVLLSHDVARLSDALSDDEVQALLSVLSCRANGDSSEHEGLCSAVDLFSLYLKAGAQASRPPTSTLYAPILAAYERWLRRVRGNGDDTVALRRYYLVPFLEFLGDIACFNRLAVLDAERVREYAARSTAECGKSVRQTILTTLRTFLEFCFCSAYLLRDLRSAVPSLRSYTLCDVPRGLSDKHARMVLQGVDKERGTGKRDYAILKLLYTYGVRGGQVRALCLEDIDWRNDRILFRQLKRGKRSLLPLTDSVGDALEDYLRFARPKASYREVFLTSRAPFHPLWDSSALSAVVKQWIRHAGIETDNTGSHAFRHCFASRMVNDGHSLKAVADILGHRCLSSTFIYTKVDFHNLAQVALEWPEVSQ